jgi:3-oxoacyl-[acyl-carrier protein] reductase
MIKSFATDFGKRGITVNGVAPGGIKSDMFTQNAWYVTLRCDILEGC